MTLLSAQSIYARCARLDRDPAFRQMITPFTHRADFEGLSHGLGPAGYDVRTRDPIALRPHEFVIVSTVEEFDLPLDLAMTVRDKSTLARMGLSVFNTFAEPGWRGVLMVEVVNHSPWRTIRLKAGSPIAQCTFELLDYTTMQPYPEGAKYQNQKAAQGPIADGVEGQDADLAGESPFVMDKYPQQRWQCPECGEWLQLGVGERATHHGWRLSAGTGASALRAWKPGSQAAENDRALDAARMVEAFDDEAGADRATDPCEQALAERAAELEKFDLSDGQEAIEAMRAAPLEETGEEYP